MNRKDYFTSSLSLDNHPMQNARMKSQAAYYETLLYFVSKSKLNDIMKCRLNQYKDFLRKSDGEKEKNDTAIVKGFRYLRKKHRYWLMCDIALILLDDKKIRETSEVMKSHLFSWQKKQTELILSALTEDQAGSTFEKDTNQMIAQYRQNRDFAKRKEVKYIVSANMSAGKSTLINALIGKRLARASSGVCTGSICYFYEKPFEDKQIHLETPSQVNLCACGDDLSSFPWESNVSIASYFRKEEDCAKKICLIDTPGVDAARHKNHAEITYHALQNEKYDRLICVLPYSYLESTGVSSHIQWIAEHVPKEKVIFVLNGLDATQPEDDPLEKVIKDLREKELKKFGFENPIICPISALFALFIKMKQNGETLSKREQRKYEDFSEIFCDPTHDLSRYYEGSSVYPDDGEFLTLSKQSGLYGLEKTLYGGSK